MKVSVTFEFGSVAEAVHFMGKNMEGGPVAAVVMEKPKSPSAEAKPTEKRGRGRPKKTSPEAAGTDSPSSPVETPAAPAVESAAPAQETVTPPENAASTTPATAAAVPTDEALIAAMQAVMDKHDIDVVLKVLEKYGVEGARQLPAEKRAEFVEFCGKVERGEVKL